MSPETSVYSRRSQHREENHSHNKEIFPCKYPLNNHMRSYSARRETFDQTPLNISAPPDELAAAGLFHTGVRDRTKCFYCNGGLENWETADDPMVEHAKWYPECEFVLQKRGIDFVAAMAEKFPYLNRPAIRSLNSTMSGNVFTISNTRIVSPGGFITVTRNSESFDIPPQTRSEDRVSREMRHPLTKSMAEFGYDEDLIRRVIERRLATSHMFKSASDFLDAIHQLESEERERETPPTTSRNTNAQTPPVESVERGSNSPQTTTTERSVEIRIKEIQDEHRCKVCLDREMTCVFQPCGHMCSCLECAHQLRSCPICRKPITKVLRIYNA